MAKEQTATEYCEEKFPQTTKEFKKILDEMYDTFCKKQRQLVVKGQPDEVGEAIEDTYQDLSVYGVISQIVTRNKWAK